MARSKRTFIRGMVAGAAVLAGVVALPGGVAQPDRAAVVGDSDQPFWRTEESLRQRVLKEGEPLDGGCILGSEACSLVDPDTGEPRRVLHEYSDGRIMLAEYELLEGDRVAISYTPGRDGELSRKPVVEVWRVDGRYAYLQDSNEL